MNYFLGGSDCVRERHHPKKGGVNVKKKFYNFMGWFSLIVGAVLFIIPGLPGTPILLLSKYFFSI
ncbi:hypothetical protein [Nitrospira sp. Ecomares 2.1]